MEVVLAVADGRMVFPFTDLREFQDSPLAGLSAREREFLAALAAGHTNAQLAAEFGVSLNTVKFHLKNMYAKLQVDNRTQAAAKLH